MEELLKPYHVDSFLPILQKGYVLNEKNSTVTEYEVTMFISAPYM